jgi:hypothetical protein
MSCTESDGMVSAGSGGKESTATGFTANVSAGISGTGAWTVSFLTDNGSGLTVTPVLEVAADF